MTMKTVMATVKIRRAKEIQTKAKAVMTKANVDSLFIITIGQMVPMILSQPTTMAQAKK